MTRLGVLLLLLLSAPAFAQPGSPPKFDAARATAVYTTALTFMLPRTLEPEPIAQLTVWGLNGLTALDPDIGIASQGPNLELTLPGRVLASSAHLHTEDPAAWASLATGFAQAAWTASAKIRRAGTTGVITNFFDEIFNHLDPYSRYVPPRQAAEDRERRSGSAGAGLSLMVDHDRIVVQQAIADAPGATAGIKTGDTILAVNGQSTLGSDPTTVTGWIEGPEQTRVSITFRNRDSRARTVDIMRVMVPPQTVFTSRLHDALLLRITDFNHETSVRVARALTDAMHTPPGAAHAANGIILDLRGNRGGLVTEATGVADEFLPAGLIAQAIGRDPDATRIWRSDDGQLADDLPVVVLVDGRTASAAEILTAALSDRGRAVVVGSATLGKGLVQTIAPLPDGGELFVTWSRVLAPRDWPLQGLGVLPQVCTSLGHDALASELASLDDGTQPMAEALAHHRAARAPLPPAQALAIRGACPAAEGTDADVTTADYLIQHPAAYVTALLPPMRFGALMAR